jgi:hypothetical protein
MAAIGRALHAETLKLKRTLALRLAVVAPLSLAVLDGAVAYQRGAAGFRNAENVWLEAMYQMFFFSSYLMLPLFIGLLATWVTDVESDQDNAGWKHLFALPLPRWAIYGAKQLAAMALTGISVGLLGATTVLTGLTLQALKPEIVFEPHIPWGRLGAYTVGIYLSSWLMISLHTWISARWKGFVLPLGISILATFLAMVVGETALAPVYPWSLPAFTAHALSKGVFAWGAVAWGSLGGIVAAVVGCACTVRRDVL